MNQGPSWPLSFGCRYLESDEIKLNNNTIPDRVEYSKPRESSIRHRMIQDGGNTHANSRKFKTVFVVILYRAF